MDTLTHALSGALLARATGRAYRDGGLSLQERSLAGFVAAGFPDLDYLFYWIEPLRFLNWHRGPTHSLLLLPLWAWLLAMILARLFRNRYPWRAFYGVCALGIAVHIVGDIITIYGTQVFSPLTDRPLALGITFDVDPSVAIVIAVGFAGSVVYRPDWAAAMTLVVLLGYLGLQTGWSWQSVAVGKAYIEQQGLQGAQAYAIPQPLLPSMWKVIIAYGERYQVAHLNHLARERPKVTEDAWLLRRLVAAYRPLHALRWDEYYRFGASEEDQSLAGRAWDEDRFAAFRRFAKLPALYRIDREDGQVCVWFTDLRHMLPILPPAFRYGMCRSDTAQDWRLYRLRYFSADDRQLL